MEIKIGENIKLGGSSKYQILSPLSGLETPEIRMGDGVYAGLDGGYLSSQLYGARTIVINGLYLGDSCSDAESLRVELASNCHIRYRYPIFITSFDGRHYYTEGYVSDLKSDITSAKYGEFQLTLYCPDPILYDGGDGTSSDSAWYELAFYKESASGFRIEYVTPVPWIGGTSSSVVTNVGSVEAYPIITLKEGAYANPTIRNLTTGKFITIGRIILPDEVLVIDMKKRVITLNGESVASDRTVDSSWWTLARGENNVVLETENSSDKDYGIIRYKIGYEGI